MTVLLVEDNPAEARLTQEALRASGLRHDLQVVTDGQMASDYLNRVNGYAAADPPCLVLLDLNLPKKTGQELLREIKSDPRLRGIPVIILSNSQSADDINECYRLRANSYLTKPAELDELFSKVRALVEFWFRSAHLPDSLE
jgi:CheY-like chemotaxis protein